MQIYKKIYLTRNFFISETLGMTLIKKSKFYVNNAREIENTNKKTVKKYKTKILYINNILTSITFNL